MSDYNGNGIHRSPNGDLEILAPPARALGAAPLPGSNVPTAQRLAQPVANISVSVPFSRLPEFVRTLFEFMGDEFEFVLNPQVIAHLSPGEFQRLQNVMREREDRRP